METDAAFVTDNLEFVIQINPEAFPVLNAGNGIHQVQAGEQVQFFCQGNAQPEFMPLEIAGIGLIGVTPPHPVILGIEAFTASVSTCA